MCAIWKCLHLQAGERCVLIMPGSILVLRRYGYIFMFDCSPACHNSLRMLAASILHTFGLLSWWCKGSQGSHGSLGFLVFGVCST